jgi:two-component system response regulator
MKTILQVEDDPNDVLFLQRAMKKAGLTNPIQIASDGQEAIDYLQGTGKFADRGKFPFPSLVLLDLRLPYVMGLDVLRWIRQQPWAALPVIMLTASGEEADIVASYRLGANAFLRKPPEASQLVDMVKAIGDFWLTHNTLPQESCMERMVSLVSLRSLGRPLSGFPPRGPFPRVEAPSAAQLQPPENVSAGTTRSPNKMVSVSEYRPRI